jgi:type II secretory pathway component PulF
MPDRLLAELLSRLATALAAGIDLRRAWAAETARVPGRWRAAMEAVAGGIAAGDGLATAMRCAGGTFPPLVRALLTVGEAAGRDAEAAREVASELERGMRRRRALRQGLAAPALRLLVALGVMGVLIMVNGSMVGRDGRPIDWLGLGLVGRQGAIRFAAWIAAAFGLAAAAWPLVARSWADHGLARAIGARVPILGPAVRDAEAAAWTRAAALASHAGLDAGRLVALASSAAPGLRLDAERVLTRLRGGASVDEALAAEGRLPRQVLEAFAVGDLTGTTAETLGRLADRLDEAAAAGFAAAIAAVGFMAWAAVAGLIALVVFRIASVYAGMLADFAKPL